MIISVCLNPAFTPVIVEHNKSTIAGYLADQRDPAAKLAKKLPNRFFPCGWCSEKEFVVLTAGEGESKRIGSDCRCFEPERPGERESCQLQPGADTGQIEDMAEIGKETVAHVDHGTGKAGAGKGHPLPDPRRGIEMPFNRLSFPLTHFQEFESQCRVAESPGDKYEITCRSAAPPHHQPRKLFPHDGYRYDQPIPGGTGIATDKNDPEFFGPFQKAGYHAVEELHREGRRNCQRKEEMARFATHCGNIGKVHCQRLPAEGCGIAQGEVKVHPFHEHV